MSFLRRGRYILHHVVRSAWTSTTSKGDLILPLVFKLYFYCIAIVCVLCETPTGCRNRLVTRVWLTLIWIFHPSCPATQPCLPDSSAKAEYGRKNLSQPNPLTKLMRHCTLKHCNARIVGQDIIYVVPPQQKLSASNRTRKQ